MASLCCAPHPEDAARAGAASRIAIADDMHPCRSKPHLDDPVANESNEAGFPPDGSSDALPNWLSKRFALDTRDLPPQIRFDAWRAFWSPVLHVTARPEAAADFEGRATLRPIGRLLVLRMEAEPARYRRARSQAIRDGLDHWFIGLETGPRSGNQAGEADAVRLGSLGRGFGLSMGSRHFLGIFLPPEWAPQLAPAFAVSRRFFVRGPQEKMLAGMLPRLAATADHLEATQVPQLEAAVASILSACLHDWELRLGTARTQLEAARRARVIALMDAELGEAELGPALLAQRAGISRSELYRCFAPLGGIAHVIQLRRLRRAHAMLTWTEGPTLIGRIGEVVGFPDPSSFTRAFRREFGYTPSELVARRAPAFGHQVPGLMAALGLR